MATVKNCGTNLLSAQPPNGTLAHGAKTGQNASEALALASGYFDVRYCNLRNYRLLYIRRSCANFIGRACNSAVCLHIEASFDDNAPSLRPVLN